jgi:hypothetical protein
MTGFVCGFPETTGVIYKRKKIFKRNPIIFPMTLTNNDRNQTKDKERRRKKNSIFFSCQAYNRGKRENSKNPAIYQIHHFILS